MAYTGITSNPFTVPGTAAGFLDIRKRGTTGPVVTVAVPASVGTSSQAPSVTINGSSTGTTGTQQSFQAVPTPASGLTTTKVELLLMANATTLTSFTVLDTDITSPYVLNWTPTSAGTFNLRTRATDNQNATGFSSVLTVAVQAATTAPGGGSSGSTPTLARRDLLRLTVSPDRLGVLYPAFAASDYSYAFASLPPCGVTSVAIPAGALKVSQAAGVVSDADIFEGSTNYGTDNTAAIQQFLDQAATNASASNLVHIDWDVNVSVTGLRYHSYCYIHARPGTGAIMRGTPTGQGTKAIWENYNARNFSVRDTTCGIFGGTWNHNSFSGDSVPNGDGNYNQRHSGADIGWNCPIRIYNVDNFTGDGWTIIRQRTFAVHALNTTNLVLTNGIINAGSNGAVINTDGLHLNFSNSGFTIDNWQINSHDDKVAISVNDSVDRDVRGGNSTYYQPYYQNSTPVIENGTVTNIEFTGGVFGIRVLSGANPVRNVLFKNIFGRTQNYWLIMDNFWQSPSFDGGGVGHVSNVTFENINVEVTHTGLADVNECGACINCNATGITFRNVTRSKFTRTGMPELLISGAATVVSNLTWDAYRGNDLDGNAFQTSHVAVVAAQVNGLTITNALVGRLGSATGNALVELVSGSLSNLAISDTQVDGLASLVKHTGGTLGNVTATNFLHYNAGSGNGSFASTASPGPKVAASAYTTTQLLQGTFTTV